MERDLVARSVARSAESSPVRSARPLQTTSSLKTANRDHPAPKKRVSFQLFEQDLAVGVPTRPRFWLFGRFGKDAGKEHNDNSKPLKKEERVNSEELTKAVLKGRALEVQKLLSGKQSVFGHKNAAADPDSKDKEVNTATVPSSKGALSNFCFCGGGGGAGLQCSLFSRATRPHGNHKGSHRRWRRPQHAWQYCKRNSWLACFLSSRTSTQQRLQLCSDCGDLIVHQDGATPLCLAAGEGAVAATMVLLSRGARADMAEKVFNPCCQHPICACARKFLHLPVCVE